MVQMKSKDTKKKKKPIVCCKMHIIIFYETKSLNQIKKEWNRMSNQSCANLIISMLMLLLLITDY